MTAKTQMSGQEPHPSDLIYNDLTELIHDTPLLEITRLRENEPRGSVFAKMESMNPGGSVKDRIALSMIEAAEAAGKLQADGTVIEPTNFLTRQREFFCICDTVDPNRFFPK